jgi:hypothetical protein
MTTEGIKLTDVPYEVLTETFLDFLTIQGSFLYEWADEMFYVWGVPTDTCTP